MTSKYNRYFTKEEDDTIKDQYMDKPYVDIGVLIGRTPNAIKDRIIKLQLPKKHIVKKWSLSDIQILNANYHKDPYIHEKLNRSKQSASFKAHKLGLKAAGRGLSRINQDYFKKLTNNNAYIIGVIASDGNLHKHKPNWGGVINITQKDGKVWLRNILNKMEPMQSVDIHTNKHDVDYVAFRSQEIYEDLIEYNVLPAKSLTISKVNIPKEYFASFLLGVYDGDGGMYIPADIETNTKQSQNIAFHSGSWNFLNWIAARITRYTGLPRKKITNKVIVRKDGSKSKVYRLKYNGPICVDLTHWMYVNSNTELHLQRKFDLYMKQISLDVVKRRYDKSTHPRHNTLSKPQFICGGKT